MVTKNDICFSLCLSVLFCCAIGEVTDNNYDNFNYQTTTEIDDGWLDITLDPELRATEHLMSDFVINIESKLLKLEKSILEKLDRKLETSNSEKHALEDINKKLSSLETKINGLEENKYFRLDTLEERNEKTLAKMVTKIEENIISKLDALKKLLSSKEQLAGFNNQMDSELKKNETVLSTFETNTDHIEEVTVIDKAKVDMDKIFMDLNDPSVLGPLAKPRVLSRIGNSSEVVGNFSNHCMEELSYGYNWTAHELDSSSFYHTIVKKNDTGVSEFEMHIAIKAARDGIVVLSPVTDPTGDDLVFEIAIGVYNNVRTDLRLTVGNGDNTLMLDTYDILSPLVYTPFYIKIKDGNLKFGVEGSPPLISHDNPGLSALKYIFFTTWNFNRAQYLIDCPVPV